ncbi:MAG: peptidylprolyl isomerase [Geobacteraceae bacterium]|nr:peptidylprolyl isomerase [Geobacteraceae bacterium]
MNYVNVFRALATMLLAFGLFACKPATTEQGKAEGTILAEVNGIAITTQDFKNEVDRLPAYLKPMVQSPEGKKELLDSMVVREIILEQAKKDGVDKSKDVADRLEDLRKRLIVETYLKKKVEQEAQISDADLKKFYDENKDKFKTGEQVRASHILVKTEKEAQDILAQLKSGANFEDLAKKYSTDATAAKGGDLGWFSKGAMVPEFDKVVFGLKEGQLSGIVKTQFGYHIIKVTGVRPAGIRAFDEVKEQIKSTLLPSKQQEIFQKMKEDLKKNAKVSIKEDVLKNLDLTAGDAQGAAAVQNK